MIPQHRGQLTGFCESKVQQCVQVLLLNQVTVDIRKWHRTHLCYGDDRLILWGESDVCRHGGHLNLAQFGVPLQQAYTSVTVVAKAMPYTHYAHRGQQCQKIILTFVLQITSASREMEAMCSCAKLYEIAVTALRCERSSSVDSLERILNTAICPLA